MLGANIIALALWLFQEEAMQFDPISMWRSMGWSARTVVILLFIMSAWSIGVMIDRWIAYQSARKQSRIFAPAVAGALKDGRIDEAISIAEQNKRSHLAQGVTAGVAGGPGPPGPSPKPPGRDEDPQPRPWRGPAPVPPAL